MTEILQIGLIVLIGIGHIKLLLDDAKMSDKLPVKLPELPKLPGATKGVPYYLYGQFVRFAEMK